MASKETVEKMMMVEKDLRISKIVSLFNNGFTTKEISIIIGEPESNVKKLINYGQNIRHEIR